MPRFMGFSMPTAAVGTHVFLMWIIQKNTAGGKRTMRISVGGVLLCMCKISPGHSDWPSNSVAVLSYPLLELIK